MDNIKIEYLPIKELKPYERNQRKHADYDISQIMVSIQKYGFNDPIGIWSDKNIIVEGHGRLAAAKKLHMKEVPVIRLDHLTDEQRKEYAIIHNKTAELSEWDMDLLAEDIPQLDFSDFEIDWGLKSNDDTDDDNDAEIEFSEILGEENNYIVLQFKNDIDWLQAQSLFDIKNVKCYSTRKDGKITKKMERVGVGRVLDGAEVLKKLTGENL